MIVDCVKMRMTLENNNNVLIGVAGYLAQKADQITTSVW